MRITRVLRSDCPSGIDCDRVYDTDGNAIAVQGRRVMISDLAAPPPTGTTTVLVARHLLDGVARHPEVLVDAGPDIAVHGRRVTDPATIGIRRTPPAHEAVVLVDRAHLPGLSVT